MYEFQLPAESKRETRKQPDAPPGFVIDLRDPEALKAINEMRNTALNLPPEFPAPEAILDVSSVKKQLDQVGLERPIPSVPLPDEVDLPVNQKNPQSMDRRTGLIPQDLRDNGQQSQRHGEDDLPTKQKNPQSFDAGRKDSESLRKRASK